MELGSLEYAYGECISEEHKKVLSRYLSGKVEDLVYGLSNEEKFWFVPTHDGRWKQGSAKHFYDPCASIRSHYTSEEMQIDLSFTWDFKNDENERQEEKNRKQKMIEDMKSKAGKQIHAFRKTLRSRFVESACGPGGLAFYVFETGDVLPSPIMTSDYRRRGWTLPKRINTLLALYKNHWTFMTLALETKSSFGMKIKRYTYADSSNQMMQNQTLQGCSGIEHILSVMDKTTFGKNFAGVRWDCMGGLCTEGVPRPKQLAFALYAKDANKDTKPSRTRPKIPVDVIDSILQKGGALLSSSTEDIVAIMDSYNIESGLLPQDVHVSSSFTPSPYCFCASCGKLIG
jgi:hypothetical protein